MCTASSACIFILYLFVIVYVFFPYFIYSFLKTLFFFHSPGVLGHPRLSCSAVQPLFGSTDGGTWAGVFPPGLFSPTIRESTALLYAVSMMQILREVPGHCSCPSSEGDKPTTAHAALCREETDRQTTWWYLLPLSRIRPVSKQDFSNNQFEHAEVH